MAASRSGSRFLPPEVMAQIGTDTDDFHLQYQIFLALLLALLLLFVDEHATT